MRIEPKPVWKNRIIFLIAMLVSGSVAAPAREAPAPGMYDSYTGFAMAANPVLPQREVHPSLWFSLRDVPALQARIARDEFSAGRWREVLKRADLNAPDPPAPAASAPTELIHRYYGAMSIRARAHALASLLVNDEPLRTAHRRRAVALLERAYDGPIFSLDSKEQGSAVDEIYRGTWLQNYAHAYDCVAATLTAAEDKQIRERLVREAECVYENLYRWAPGSPHNHLSKPAWGLGSMALALSSHPHAGAWLGRAIEAANRNTRYFFSGDGIYREGNHYLIFSLTNLLPFLYHYRNVTGVDVFPTFQPVFEAMVETRNSRGWLPPIADSYLRPTPTHLAAAAYRSARTRLHSVAPLAEILMWSYRTCDLTPFEQEAAQSGLSYTGATGDYPLEIDELLTYDPSIRATAPDAGPNVFLRSGITCLRDGWARRTDGQRYLLFDGLASADNHQHDDHLSFILEAEGQLMCSDSGYSRGSYTGAERKGWYATAPAHNTVTFNGRAARDRSPNATPPSRFRVDAPGLAGEEKETYFGGDATWRRAIFEVANDYYVICDRVLAQQPGRIAGYLHGGRATLARSGPEFAWNYVDDRYGRAAALHTWISAPGASFETRSGELTYIKGDYAEYPYLEVHATSAACAWLTLLKPTATGGAGGFTVQDVGTGERSGFVISTRKQECVVSARPTSSPRQRVSEVESDAAFFLVRRTVAGRLLAWIVLDGTYLTVSGQEAWRVDTPRNASFVAP